MRGDEDLVRSPGEKIKPPKHRLVEAYKQFIMPVLAKKKPEDFGMRGGERK